MSLWASSEDLRWRLRRRRATLTWQHTEDFRSEVSRCLLDIGTKSTLFLKPISNENGSFALMTARIGNLVSNSGLACASTQLTLFPQRPSLRTHTLLNNLDSEARVDFLYVGILKSLRLGLMHFTLASYVDEVQDNLLIDIRLLRSLCSNPHGSFWAGDTAQTISAGSSFRFDDLKAALYRLEVREPTLAAYWH
jgi:hypothetical protein